MPSDCFYVGVTRYVRRRWLGDDLDLPPEHAHGNNWQVMYILATYSEGIGKIEDFLIHCLRLRFGRLACANIRQGGGGTHRRKPSMLYIPLSTVAAAGNEMNAGVFCSVQRRGLTFDWNRQLLPITRSPRWGGACVRSASWAPGWGVNFSNPAGPPESRRQGRSALRKSS